jgi:4-diphosphocytidyl-2-C-methyl-D-erythritol kinase
MSAPFPPPGPGAPAPRKAFPAGPRGLVVAAPAKLNLFLEVLGKRADGFHDLETLMVGVNLYDTLEVRPRADARLLLTCDRPDLPTGPDNLVVKAADRLRLRAGRSELGADLHLAKRIPTQAGLAGGSSDAAATLVALDRLWDLQTPPDRLDALAGQIGSDVAFFRHAPAAICRGRGERVDAVPVPRPLAFVLVCPPIGVRTASVYRHLVVPEQPRPLGPALEALTGGTTADLGRSLFNRLQGVAESLNPMLTRVREALETLGPSLDGHMMSGSGSAYFGLGRDLDAARHAARRLETLGLGRVRVVTCGP